MVMNWKSGNKIIQNRPLYLKCIISLVTFDKIKPYWISFNVNIMSNIMMRIKATPTPPPPPLPHTHTHEAHRCVSIFRNDILLYSMSPINPLIYVQRSQQIFRTKIYLSWLKPHRMNSSLADTSNGFKLVVCNSISVHEYWWASFLCLLGF